MSSRFSSISTKKRYFGSQLDELSDLLDAKFSCSFNGNSESVASVKDFALLQENTTKLQPPKGDIYSPQTVLLSKVVRACGRDFENRSESILRHLRDGLNESVVADVIRIVKVPELSVKFFMWAGRQIGFSHTASTYDALVDVLGFHQKNKALESFLRDIGDDDREVLGRLLNVLVVKCCRQGLWSEALDELGRLKNIGYRPTSLTYNALIQVMARAEQLDIAFLVHREMSGSGFSMDKFTMGGFARALCKAGRWVEALNLIAREDFMLDTVLCTQMIDGLLEASLFEEAMSFLHRLRANSCNPNVVTYRTLLSGFLKKRQLGWCKRIIKMMITEGCNPSPALFNSLVHNYCKVRDYDYAYKLLKKMDVCDCPPSYVTYNIFIGSICGQEELPDSNALSFAEKAYSDMLCSGVLLNKINVANFAQCLCFSGKPDKAFAVLEGMIRKGFHPDASTYSKFISFLCQVRKVEKALFLFEEMKKTDIVPDVYTYTILIDGFCKVGLIQQARRWLEEMPSNGCTPNVVTYTSLVHAYLKEKRLSEANDIFNRMLSSGCNPNIVTYTALIDGLCKAGEIDTACQIYSKLLGKCEDGSANVYLQVKHDTAVHPNVMTLGALVDGLCKAKKVSEAHNILNNMMSSGCQPNLVVFDALIDGFCKIGNISDAQKIVARMTECGYSPSLYTYSSLIDRLFKEKKLELSMNVLAKMLEGSFTPDVVTYTSMIDGLCKVGKIDEALKLSSVMKDRGCSPNVITYTALIDGFGKANHVDMCLKLFREMSSEGCLPNFITYKVLINHCCIGNRIDEAYQLLEEMKLTHWPRHVRGHKEVIEGFSKEFICSLGLLEEMAAYDGVLIGSAYAMLIDGFCKSDRLDTAFDLCKELIAMPKCSNVEYRNMLLSLVQGLCMASKVEKALELYSAMTRIGAVPGMEMFVCLVKGLYRVHKWPEALQLCYAIFSEGVVWQDVESLDGG